MRRVTGALLISMATCSLAGAQGLDADFQVWSSVAVSGPASDDSRLLLWFDGHARFRDDASDLGVTIARPGIGYRVNPKLDLWFGYARVVSRSEAAPDVDENRLWQQATFPLGEALGGALSARTRLEQRFRPGGDETGWRLRQFVRWERLLPDTEFSVVFWDEWFLGLNDADWGQRAGFDQNRLFAGGAWRAADGVRFEAGYLNNVVNQSGAADRMNHNVSVTLFIAL